MSKIIKQANKISIKYFGSVVVHHKKRNNLTLKQYLKTFRIPFVIEKFNNLSLKEIEYVIELLKENNILKEDLNKTFYRKLSDVLNSSREELLLDQIIHYATTYGKIGFSNKSDMYHKNKNLDKKDKEKLKELSKDLKIIPSIYIEDFIEKTLDLINKNIALPEEDAKTIAYVLTKKRVNIKDIKNREVKYYFSLFSGIFDFENLGRLVNHILINKPLFMKGKHLKNKDDHLYLFRNTRLNQLAKNAFEDKKIGKKNALKVIEKFFENLKYEDFLQLAERFNRDKELFLFMKTLVKEKNPKAAKNINRISKLSKEYHKPIKNYMLKLVSDEVDFESFKKYISKLDTANLVKITNALKMRVNAVNSDKFLSKMPLFIVIRHGKRYFTEVKIPEDKKLLFQKYDFIRQFLKEKILKSIKDNNIVFKNFDYINLAIPYSKKKFVGNYPVGSELVVDRNNLILGISWFGKEVDFDLSVIGSQGKVGWNGEYCIDDDNIFFSGDITSAPYGATELIWIKNASKIKDIFKVNVHLYNSPREEEKFKFFLGVKEKLKEKKFNKPIEKILKPEDIKFVTTFKLINFKSIELGVLLKDKFVFVNFEGKEGVTNYISYDEKNALELYANSFIHFLDIFTEDEIKKINNKTEKTKEKIILDFKDIKIEDLLKIID